MQAVGHDINGNFTLAGICPHCKRDSAFLRVTGNYAFGSTRNDQRGYPVYRLAAALQCQACKGLILGAVTQTHNSADYTYDFHYPLGKPDDAVAAEIPLHIQPDFKEALRCLWVNAYNATAEMCRRAVEASCINLGAPANLKILEDKIDWLEEQRKITPFLRDVAHKIRLGGNRAAHPPEVPPGPPVAEPIAAVEDANPTPISAIEKEHAEAIVKFTREFFHHVYVVPKQLDKYDFSKPKAVKTP